MNFIVNNDSMMNFMLILYGYFKRQISMRKNFVFIIHVVDL